MSMSIGLNHFQKDEIVFWYNMLKRNNKLGILYFQNLDALKQQSC
jgi:hypothetical protein